jgi:hypothetical protein
MKQNKTNFIMDYYVAVGPGGLEEMTDILNTKSVAYVVEPWPEENARIYVRKDAARVLKEVEEEVYGPDTKTDGTRMPKQSPGQRLLLL